MKQLFVLMFLSLCFFFSCKKEKERLPVITTSKVAVNYRSATCTAVLYLPGDSKITEKGFCWSTSKEPTINDNKVVCGEGDGNFSTKIDSLSGNRNHYVRAYAINKFGISYGSPVKFRPYDGLVTDIDGNVYPTVKIGTQEWMGANLRATHYRNGGSAAFTFYNNSTSLEEQYGKLYDWHTASSTQNIAPVGWHVPTFAEWNVLLNYLGSTNAMAFDKLKEGKWSYVDAEFMNESGFGALPGGWRDGSTGQFYNEGFTASFWCADSYTSNDAYRIRFNATSPSNWGGTGPKHEYLSIRCVKD